MRGKSWYLKDTVIAVICLLIGSGIALPGCHLFDKQDAISDIEIAKTVEMVNKVIYYENGEQKIIDIKSESGIEIANLLARTLHRINVACLCICSEEEIQEIRETDRCVELIFQSPIDVTINRWIEPEKRDHIKTDEEGYNILENNSNALFIIEDNLEEGLDAEVKVGRESDGTKSYTGWIIDLNPEGRGEKDESWVHSLERMISELP